MDISELLTFAVKHNASDLHVSAGEPPMIRVDGDIKKIKAPALDEKQAHDLIYDVMTDDQRKNLEQQLETDFSMEIPNVARFRVNAYHQDRGLAAAFRAIPSEILTLEDLAGPDIFKKIVEKPRGLILVTGPTGSGKSTTLYGAIG
ncbi:MAG: type IV pilus twitching motility protein PilT, partial [Thiohalorhabdaceae bacterium]